MNDETQARLRSVGVPTLDATLGDIAADLQCEPSAEGLVVRVTLPFAAAGLHAEIRDEVAAQLASGGEPVAAVQIEQRIPAFGVQRNLKPLPGIANILAVASGKGGVGKSTTAVNLALALAAEGASVGILDADIYGPSIPRMLGLVGEQPLSEDGKTLQPLEAHGLQAMSIGFLVDDTQPMVWRGPMVTQALNQLMTQTAWRALDYLVVDMPPGTGDIQLTLTQRVPVAGAVIVTTPQDIALADARKGLEMFRKVSVPVLGIVENMSLYRCPECGHEASIFGAGGGARLAGDAGVRLLGELPLEREIGALADSGKPSVAADPDSPASRAYRRIAIETGRALSQSRRDYSSAFPNIVVEDS